MEESQGKDVRRRVEWANRNIAWILAGMFWVWILAMGIYSISTTMRDVTFARQTALRSMKADVQKGTSCMVLVDPAVHSFDGWAPARLLARADPEGYAYLESHPVLVSFVGNTDLATCESNHGDNPSYALNILGTSAILINHDKVSDDRTVAAVLSHELVHVRYGDLRDPASHRSILSQLWLSEEAAAHLRSMKTAALLHAPGLPSELSQTVKFVYPISTTLIVMLFSMLMVEAVRRIQSRA